MGIQAKRQGFFDNFCPVQYSDAMQFRAFSGRWSCLLLFFTFSLDLFTTSPAYSEQPLPETKRLQSSPVLRHLRPNPVYSLPRTPAEETVSQMYLPDGFRAELIASEPDLQQPVAFAFDERGRI